ncbi:transposase domain-containing protein [Bradyrhizobium brasilense]|uniref:transposase domain-containing protein n=1 Tax=Bradyrhizobium brasilense TaxID=1419277 RepID=UPI0035C6CB4A
MNTAKLHELDPQAYLTDVLERIVSGEPRAISCTSCSPGTGRRRAGTHRRQRHEPTSP